MPPVDEPFPGLAGSRVVVTGGTRGIGAGIARGFLRVGARVLVCGRHEPASPPSADGRTAAFIQADVRDPEHARRLMAAGADLLGGVDVVISNAGGSPPVAAASASPRFHAKIIELNLIAPLHVAQAGYAVMQGQPAGGSIIMIGSVSGSRPSPGTAAYGAAKAAMSCPATCTVPPSAFTSVVSTLTVVVFPAPFGPSREKTVPAGTSRSMPSRTILSPYAFRSPEAAMAELLMRPPSAPGLTRP